MLALELGAAAWVTFIVGEAGPDRIALANRLALLVGAFQSRRGSRLIYFINGTAMSSEGKPARVRRSAPVTTATFDHAVVALGVERSGIAVFTGEA